MDSLSLSLSRKPSKKIDLSSSRKLDDYLADKSQEYCKQLHPLPGSIERIWHLPDMRNVNSEWSMKGKMGEASVSELMPEASFGTFKGFP